MFSDFINDFTVFKQIIIPYTDVVKNESDNSIIYYGIFKTNTYNKNPYKINDKLVSKTTTVAGSKTHGNHTHNKIRKTRKIRKIRKTGGKSLKHNKTRKLSLSGSGKRRRRR